MSGFKREIIVLPYYPQARVKNILSEKKYTKKSEIPVLTQPVCLGREVPVDDIALVVLKAPGRDDQNIPFPYPDAFFDLAFDPSHPGNTIVTPHPDMICPHHEIGKSELFICPFFWQPYPDNGGTVFIYCVRVKIIIIIGIISNSPNSVGIDTWCVMTRRYVLPLRTGSSGCGIFTPGKPAGMIPEVTGVFTFSLHADLVNRSHLLFSSGHDQ